MLTSGSLLQNRYRIMQPLGSGGQGAVYLALHLGLNAYVALKESFSNDAVANAQFQAEANLLAHLSHPNLPRVTDFFIEPNGARYLVMEYVQGENLETIVRQRGAPISENEVLNWFHQIFDAVNYLHANRVIHRDIKPQNIIITPQHRAVLVDFGIAKVMASGGFTGQSVRFGTPGYASPEQYSGGTDERSDIYSLGATLYFALTGQTPPEAPLRASGVRVIPPRQFNPGISANAERAVMKAMSLDATQRQSRVAELANSLLVPAVAFNTLTNSPLKQASRIFDLRLIGFGLGILLTLFIVGLFVTNTLQNSQPKTPNSRPTVLIASPPSGTIYTIGEQLAVESTSNDPNGVRRVELSVDGIVVQSDINPVAQGATQFSVIQSWTVDSVGQHSISVRAFNLQNAFGESEIRVQVQSPAVTVISTPIVATVTEIPTATPLSPTGTEIPTSPPEPTSQPSPAVTVIVVTAVPQETPVTCTLSSKFVADVTIPDGTIFIPDAVFTKTWRVQNSGTCAWDNYSLVFVSGTNMAASAIYPVPSTQPGATADLVVPMIAPSSYGSYASLWRLRDANGQLFGTTLDTVINVAAPPTPVSTIAPNLAQNLAPNPSFEQGASSPNQWVRDLFQYAQMNLENTVSHFGAKSLSITTPACNAEGVKYHVRWMSDPIQVKVNADYHFLVWVKSERSWGSTDGSADIGLGIPLVKEFLPTPDWTRIGFTFRPQTDTVQLELGYFSGECHGQANKIYFDDIEFGE